MLKIQRILFPKNFQKFSKKILKFFRFPEQKITQEIIINSFIMLYTEDVVLKEHTIEVIEEHNQKDDAWIVLDGKVYDITDFLEDPSNHPGGISVILDY